MMGVPEEEENRLINKENIHPSLERAERLKI